MSSALLSESKSQISVIIVLFGILSFYHRKPPNFLSYNIYYSLCQPSLLAIMALSLTL